LSAVAASQALGFSSLTSFAWRRLPVGSSFTGFGYSYTDFDIAFDPSLEIEDATAEVHTLAFNYLHVIDVFGKSGRIDLLVQHSNGRWEGLLQGVASGRAGIHGA
jgi:hypothetical protein